MNTSPLKIADLLSFNPEEGKITFNDRRMLILESTGFGLLRRELINTLGEERTRALLFRFGFQFGGNDARSLKSMRSFASPKEWWEAGPPMRALEGIAVVEPRRVVFDPPGKRFEVELALRNSHEAENAIRLFGKSSEPVCWFMAGFASGHASACFGETVVFTERTCAAAGASECLLEGRRAEDCAGRGADCLKYLEGESIEQILDSMRTEIDSLRTEVGEQCSFMNVVGRSPAIVKVLELACDVARTESTVLLLGESGTGKELMARAIHHNSRRTAGPFVAVNCAAIHDTLLESELFGHEKGAFTGADKAKPGKFERAAGGTLFLDEIGDMNPALQAKVLRVLQEREFERVGGSRLLRADVRIIAATNRDLRELVRDRTFREDLFYRINGFPVTIPPLRERTEDILPLARHFLKRFINATGKKDTDFSADAEAALKHYAWPGNVRELQNAVERAVILNRDARITAALLGVEGSRESGAKTGDAPIKLPPEGVSIEEVERSLLVQAMEASHDNKTAAARLLGLTRAAMRYRLEKFGLDT